MKTSSLTCESIFSISGDHPEYTYVDRREFAKQLVDALSAHQIAFVTGISKSGKTLLVKHTLVFNKINYVLIRGSEVKDESTFWELLAAQLNISQARKSKSKLQLLILEKMLQNTMCLVVDDFHYTPDYNLRLSLLRLMKIFNEEGIAVVLIAVQSPQAREVELVVDINARTVNISLSQWSIEELTRIASKGFNNQGTAVMQLSRLAQESFGSPFLMQLLCQLYCRTLIRKYPNSKVAYLEKVDREDLTAILPSAAKSVSSSHVYAILTHPKLCSINREFLRHDGKRGNLNQMILYAISGNYPEGAMPYLEIHISRLDQRLSQCLLKSEDLIPTDLIFESVSNMVDGYRQHYETTYTQEEVRHDPIIDLIGQILYVRDPFFLFYLRHSPEVEKQFV